MGGWDLLVLTILIKVAAVLKQGMVNLQTHEGQATNETLHCNEI